MSAEMLRQAAALMRERAEAATPGPWGAVAGAWGLPSSGPDHMRVVRVPHKNAIDAIVRAEYDRQGGADAEHIASWHPAVTLAVAASLESLAEWIEVSDLIGYSWGRHDFVHDLLTVARAYLGGDA